jgi:hypothetical protein
MRHSSFPTQFILPAMSLSKEMIVRSAFVLCSIDMRCGDSTCFRVLNDDSQAAVDSEQWTVGCIIFNIYIDISQAKIFLQSVNIGEGALGFSRGTAPLAPLGYRPGLDYITGFAVSVVCRLQYCCQRKNSICRVVTMGGIAQWSPPLNTPLTLFSSGDCCSSHK